MESSNKRPLVFILASWYPGLKNPVAGIFISEQVKLIKGFADVCVIAVQIGDSPQKLTSNWEDGAFTVRAVVSDRFFNRVPRFDRVSKMQQEAFALAVKECGTPDLIHVQALWPAGLGAAKVSKQSSIPFVVTEHSEEYLPETEMRFMNLPGVLPLLIRPLAHKASAYIAVSDVLADRIKFLGLSDRVTVIPNVLSAEMSDSDLSRKKCSGKIEILHASILSPAKNLPLLLEATKLLSESRDDFHLSIIGEGGPHDLSRLQVFAQEIDIPKEAITFLGRIPPQKMPQYYKECSFAVLSSTHETFSTFSAEAILRGRPVVSTRCGGPESFITDEVGLLVDSKSVEGLYEGMMWMCENYATFKPEALHQYAEKRFSQRVIGPQIRDVYSSVLK